jgi:hypothetical protein
MSISLHLFVIVRDFPIPHLRVAGHEVTELPQPDFEILYARI